MNIRRTPKMGRRAMLGALASSAAALPFLRSFPVAAEGPARPKLILLGLPGGPLVGPYGDGNNYDGWRPQGFSGYESPLPANLPSIFAPLEPHVDRLLFLEGMGQIQTPEQATVGHAQHLNILTGRGHYQPPGTTSDMEEGTGDGISVDQFLGDELGSPVLNTAFDPEGFLSSHWTYRDRAQPAIPILNPVDAYSQVFGDGLDTATAEKLLRQRTSVLDTIAGDLGAMKARVPVADRIRLEAHLDSVRGLEQTLANVADLSCNPSGAPAGYEYGADENFPQVVRDMSTTIVQALTCGWGQVATLQFGGFGGTFRPKWSDLGINSSFSAHAIAHKFVGEGGAGSDGLSQAEAIPLALKIEEIFSSLIANLLEQLETTLDTDGQPMLDNTLVVNIRPMGENHDANNAVWMAAGGNALGVKTGRYLRVSEGTYNNHRTWNDALVGICRTMGVDIDSFGDPQFNDEPLNFG